jgi:hypothetical protein
LAFFFWEEDVQKQPLGFDASRTFLWLYLALSNHSDGTARWWRIHDDAILLAQHYTEAGLAEQALPYWPRAGQQALQRSANLEAVVHLTSGLEFLPTLPSTPARAQQKLDLLIVLGRR